MPIISRPFEYTADDVYVDLRPTAGIPLFLKCEAFNFAGSIKLKAAAEMVEQAERNGVLRPESVVVESSSGNLGIALSMVAASKGYEFLCVTDPRCNPGAARLMKAVGARVHVVTDKDDNGGYLGSRIQFVRSLCDSDHRYVWLNQYANPDNWRAHYRTTAVQIASAFPDLDVVFVGAGTTGTLMGCARFFRNYPRPVTVVAVDAVGSVIFDQNPATRYIPGLGASVCPPLLDRSYVDDVVHVREPDAIAVCHRLARHGFLFGGSTGSVVAGAAEWLRVHDPEQRRTAVAISPDLGERYLESLYDAQWLDTNLGSTVAATVEPIISPLSEGIPACLSHV